MRAAVSLALALALPLALISLDACSKDDTPSTTAPDGAAPAPEEAGSADSSSPADLDSATNPDAGAQPDADGPGKTDDVCSFNRDCMSALRCECDETAGCACKPGARGTGKNGIDPCTSGNECASSLCIEGPPDSGMFCSDECMTGAQCTGKLPQCSTIAGIGRVCIRAN